MRNFIIALSILFFALSAFIIFKALITPARNDNYHNKKVKGWEYSSTGPEYAPAQIIPPDRSVETALAGKEI